MTKPIVPLTDRPLNNFGSVRVSEEKGDRISHPVDKKPSPHKGIDLVPTSDKKVFATHSGTVEKVDFQQDEVTQKGWGYLYNDKIYRWEFLYTLRTFRKPS